MSEFSSSIAVAGDVQATKSSSGCSQGDRSTARTEANRRNALKSTGPRTPAGKARSALNAVTHGLYATRVVSAEETIDAFEGLRRQLIDEWRPASVLEVAMVDQIAELLWRRRRVAAVEASMLEATEYASPYGPIQVARNVTEMLRRQLRSSDSVVLQIQLYQSRIDRALHQALGQLRRLQLDRRQRDASPWSDSDAFELDAGLNAESGETKPNADASGESVAG